MRPRRPALGAGLLVLALSGPLLASWVVGGGGSAAATAAVLGTPTGLATSDVTATGLRLSWAAPGGPTPDAYVVRRNGTVVSSCAPVTATSCTDAGLEPGTPYSYTVTAALRSWRGSPSAAATATTRVPAPTDSTPPTVTAIGRLDPTPTSAASVRWRVVFSEPVTGVGAADVVLASQVSGAAVTAVDGSGATWTVTASTGTASTGTGDIGLDLVDDDTVVDAAGNRLGGTGTGNGAFVGEVYAVARGPVAVTVEQKGTLDPTRTAPLRWTVVFSRSVTGFDVTDLARTGSSSGGTLSVTGSGADYEVGLAGPLGDGTAVLSVRPGAAVDGAGNSSAASTSRDGSITFDATAPVLTGSKGDVPGNGQSNRERFSGTSTDSAPPLTVNVYAAGGATVLRSWSVGSFTGTGSPYGWSVDTSPNDLAAGTTYRLELVQVDAAGNRTVLDAGTFTGN